MKRKVVALTGSIGSGKSEVVRVLRSLGYLTVSCDELAKQVATRPEVVDQVAALLGSEYVPDGQLDRKAIRDKVFTSEQLLSQYQAIFFDGVRQLLVDTLDKLNDEVVFVEIPVMDAFDFDWTEVWRVESNQSTQIKRVTHRDGVSEQSVLGTLARQKQYRHCSRVITNNGTVDELAEAVRSALIKSGIESK